jgi:hypothetical protein
MPAAPPPPGGSAWARARDALQPEFGDAAFELRFSLTAAAAVRAGGSGRPVAARHAEPPDPPAPWSAAHAWAGAAGWLLAARAPADPARAAAVLERAVEAHAAELRERLGRDRAALGAELLERLTHRLRTDVSTLQAVAEGALTGLFADEERAEVRGELKALGTDSQHRLTLAREVMLALNPEAERRPEPVAEVLRAELDASGSSLAVPDVDGERPMALVPGPGWAACARLLAAALTRDERLGGAAAAISVRPDPDGWTVEAGGGGTPAEPLPWTQRSVGDLVHAGEIAVVAGGRASVARVAGRWLRVSLTVPAGPST